MTGSCACGRVSIALPERPTYLQDCNCTLCAKLGALWAYYDRSTVVVDGGTKSYTRTDVEMPTAHIHFCDNCGTTTHWSPTEHVTHNLMGVNMRLCEPDELTGVELRFPDGRTWDKTAPFGYLREHGVFGQTGASS